MIRTTAQTIKRERIKAGMTQQQLADATGFLRAQIGRLERNASNAQLQTLTKIAKALRIPITRLIS